MPLIIADIVTGIVLAALGVVAVISWRGQTMHETWPLFLMAAVMGAGAVALVLQAHGIL